MDNTPKKRSPSTGHSGAPPPMVPSPVGFEMPPAASSGVPPPSGLGSTSEYGLHSAAGPRVSTNDRSSLSAPLDLQGNRRGEPVDGNRRGNRRDQLSNQFPAPPGFSRAPTGVPPPPGLGTVSQNGRSSSRQQQDRRSSLANPLASRSSRDQEPFYSNSGIERDQHAHSLQTPPGLPRPQSGVPTLPGLGPDRREAFGSDAGQTLSQYDRRSSLANPLASRSSRDQEPFYSNSGIERDQHAHSLQTPPGLPRPQSGVPTLPGLGPDRREAFGSDAGQTLSQYDRLPSTEEPDLLSHHRRPIGSSAHSMPIVFVTPPGRGNPSSIQSSAEQFRASYNPQQDQFRIAQQHGAQGSRNSTSERSFHPQLGTWTGSSNQQSFVEGFVPDGSAEILRTMETGAAGSHGTPTASMRSDNRVAGFQQSETSGGVATQHSAIPSQHVHHRLTPSGDYHQLPQFLDPTHSNASASSVRSNQQRSRQFGNRWRGGGVRPFRSLSASSTTRSAPFDALLNANRNGEMDREVPVQGSHGSHGTSGSDPQSFQEGYWRDVESGSNSSRPKIQSISERVHTDAQRARSQSSSRSQFGGHLNPTNPSIGVQQPQGMSSRSNYASFAEREFHSDQSEGARIGATSFGSNAHTGGANQSHFTGPGFMQHFSEQSSRMPSYRGFRKGLGAPTSVMSDSNRDPIHSQSERTFTHGKPQFSVGIPSFKPLSEDDYEPTQQIQMRDLERSISPLPLNLSSDEQVDYWTRDPHQEGSSSEIRSRPIQGDPPIQNSTWNMPAQSSRNKELIEGTERVPTQNVHGAKSQMPPESDLHFLLSPDGRHDDLLHQIEETRRSRSQIPTKSTVPTEILLSTTEPAQQELAPPTSRPGSPSRMKLSEIPIEFWKRKGDLDVGLSIIPSKSKDELVGFYTTNFGINPKPYIVVHVDGRYEHYDPRNQSRNAIPPAFKFNLFCFETLGSNSIGTGKYVFADEKRLRQFVGAIQEKKFAKLAGNSMEWCTDMQEQRRKWEKTIVTKTPMNRFFEHGPESRDPMKYANVATLQNPANKQNPNDPNVWIRPTIAKGHRSYLDRNDGPCKWDPKTLESKSDDNPVQMRQGRQRTQSCMTNPLPRSRTASSHVESSVPSRSNEVFGQRSEIQRSDERSAPNVRSSSKQMALPPRVKAPSTANSRSDVVTKERKSRSRSRSSSRRHQQGDASSSRKTSGMVETPMSSVHHRQHERPKETGRLPSSTRRSRSKDAQIAVPTPGDNEHPFKGISDESNWNIDQERPISSDDEIEESHWQLDVSAIPSESAAPTPEKHQPREKRGIAMQSFQPQTEDDWSGNKPQFTKKPQYKSRRSGKSKEPPIPKPPTMVDRSMITEGKTVQGITQKVQRNCILFDNYVRSEGIRRDRRDQGFTFTSPHHIPNQIDHVIVSRRFYEHMENPIFKHKTEKQIVDFLEKRQGYYNITKANDRMYYFYVKFLEVVKYGNRVALEDAYVFMKVKELEISTEEIFNGLETDYYLMMLHFVD